MHAFALLIAYKIGWNILFFSLCSLESLNLVNGDKFIIFSTSTQCDTCLLYGPMITTIKQYDKLKGTHFIQSITVTAISVDLMRKLYFVSF